MVGGGVGGPTHYKPYLRVLISRFVNLSRSFPGVNQDMREDPELYNTGRIYFDLSQ